MSRVTTAMLTAVLASVTSASLYAQVKVIPGERITETATVEAIETSYRQVTVRMKNGELRTFTVPESATRFREIKVGDTVSATYYDNIVLRVKQAGEPDVDTLTAGANPSGGATPGASVGVQRTITATIAAIDMNVPSISLKGP